MFKVSLDHQDLERSCIRLHCHAKVFSVTMLFHSFVFLELLIATDFTYIYGYLFVLKGDLSVMLFLSRVLSTISSCYNLIGILFYNYLFIFILCAFFCLNKCTTEVFIPPALAAVQSQRKAQRLILIINCMVY